jgi:signal transduction histidine kinase
VDARGRQLLAWARQHPLFVDAAFAGVLALLVLPEALSRQDPVPQAVLIALAMTLPLAWRRRAPLAVFAAVSLVALLNLIVTTQWVAEISVLFTLYAVSVHERRPWVFPAAIAVVELGVLFATLKYADGGAVLAFASLSVFVLAASALGFYVRTRGERIAALSERARQLERERDQQAQLATAAERSRIAREMHDVVAHNLTVMIALADGARLSAAQDPVSVERSLAAVSNTGREALDEMRRLLGLLRENGDVTAPLAPQPGIEALELLLEQVRRAGIDARLTRTGVASPVSPGAQLAVYRLVQEALTNTLKHAGGASSVHVRLDFRDEALCVEVVDDGSPGSEAGGSGHGLTGMRERAAAYGGAVEAGPRHEGGWRVRARLPLIAGRTA